METLVFASGNAHKIREISELFDELCPDQYKILSLKDIGFNDEIDENGATFEENAFIKAETVAKVSEFSVIAEDSGLVVDALGGRPGIYSARYGGYELDFKGKNALLLDEMKDVPDEKRTARFVSCFVGVFKDGRRISAIGTSEGIILHEMRGSGTFGYDPVFYCVEKQKAYAEMTDDEKNAVSHRGRAVRAFTAKLK